MQRWAILKEIQPGEDLKPARTEVISIHSREEKSGPPNIADMSMRDRYEAVEIADGVVIGMVKGGKVDPIGGFGWLEEADRVQHGTDLKPKYSATR